MPARRPKICLALLLLVAGCVSTPLNQDEPISQLPNAHLKNDNVVVEIAFAEVSVHDREWLESLWDELDEQHLPIESRRALTANGLRCGLAGEQLPDILREVTNADSTDNRSVPAAVANQKQATRQLHLRPGHRSEIITASTEDAMTILLDDGTNISGHQFTAAQTLFSIQAYPAQSSRAAVQLTPELHFGDTKQRYVGKDGAFVLESRRDHRAFGNLQIDAELAPGQTLVVTCDGPSKSLGGNFFTAQDGETQKLLLVRLARAQNEILFSDDDLFDAF